MRPQTGSAIDLVYGELLTDAAKRLGDEASERTRARATAVLRIITRYEVMSGTEVAKERKDAFLYELQLARFSHAESLAAEQWIMRGKTRYGTLVLADFFPDSEQLASVGFSVKQVEEDAYKRGYNDGRRFEKKRIEDETGRITW